MPLIPWLEALAAPDVERRLDAIEALGALQDAKAVGHLVRRLREEPDAEARAAICEALGELGDARAVPPLVSMLRDDDDGVRGEAFSALLTIGQSRASRLPHDLLAGEDPRNPSLQATQIVWPADLEAIKLLDESLADGDPEVRIGACYALGKLGVHGSFNHLAWLLTHDPDADVRAAAAFGVGDLGQCGQAHAEGVLAEAWPSQAGEAEVAVCIMRALLELGAQRRQSFIAFEQALAHPDARVRQLATMGLARTHDPAAVPRLCRVLKDAHPGVRRNAAVALGQLGDALAIDALIRAVPGDDAEVRSAIGLALGQLDRPRVTDALRAAQATGDAALRGAAAYLMGRLADAEGLLAALVDVVPEVRKAAALALGNCQGPALRPALEGALADVEWPVRVAAAEGLRRLGDPLAAPTLRRHTTDPHPVVRNAVHQALRTLTGSPE